MSKAEEKDLKGQDFTTELSEVNARRTEIETIDAELRNEFAATEKKLKDARLPQEILDRHAKFVAHYDSNIKELRANIDGHEKAHKANNKAQAREYLKKAKLHLEKTKAPSRHQKLDPNNLPFRARKATKAIPPRLKKEEFERDFPQQKSKVTKKLALSDGLPDFLIQKLQPKPILLAFNDIASDIHSSLNTRSMPSSIAIADATPIVLAQAVDLPAADDLAESPDIQFTDAIRAKAAELGYSPVKIYEWVRNNIEYAPTYGSIQGADQCLQSKICNDMDTASLLIALLRVSGVYAHYAYGTVEIPVDKIMNWLGGFTDPNAALTFIASGGIPVTGLRSGGTINAARVEHVWVEAWIDYIPSRGAVHRQGDTWISLDASFKQYSYKTGLDVQQITGLDPSVLANALITSGTTNTLTGSITGIDTTLIQTQLTQAKIALESHINLIQNPTVGDVMGSKEIIKEELELLPASLPYKTAVAGAKYAETPDALRYKVGISIYDPQSMIHAMNVTYPTAYLAGKRITIAYMPETQADAQALQMYGYYEAKPYLVNLKSQLYIDGMPASTGASIGMGMQQNLSVTFTSPDGKTDIVTHEIPASTYASLGLDLQKASKDILDKRSSLLNSATKQLGQQDVAVDDIIGETLNLHNLGYFSQAETTNRMIARGKVAYSKQPAEMLTTLAPTIDYLYGMPSNISSLSTKVDVKRYPVNVVSLNGNPTYEKAFMTASGTSGSTYEHMIIEELHKDSQGVSAVKILSVANQMGMPIYTIDSANSATMLPRLRISAATIADIQNAIATGKQVTIHEQTIQYYDWHGEGFIVIDPTTGSGAYMLSGGLAGGGTAKKDDSFVEVMKDIANFINSFTDMVAPVIDSLKLGKIGAALVKIFGVIGKLLIGISALAQFVLMYNATDCVYNALAAAAADLVINLMMAGLIYVMATLLLPGGLFAVSFFIFIIIANIIWWNVVQKYFNEDIKKQQWCQNRKFKYALA